MKKFIILTFIATLLFSFKTYSIDPDIDCSPCESVEWTYIDTLCIIFGEYPDRCILKADAWIKYYDRDDYDRDSCPNAYGRYFEIQLGRFQPYPESEKAKDNCPCTQADYFECYTTLLESILYRAYVDEDFWDAVTTEERPLLGETSCDGTPIHIFIPTCYSNTGVQKEVCDITQCCRYEYCCYESNNGQVRIGNITENHDSDNCDNNPPADSCEYLCDTLALKDGTLLGPAPDMMKDPLSKISEINDKYLKIEPNPANDEIFLKFKSKLIGKFEIIIFDIYGNNIILKKFSKANELFETKLHINNLISGMYSLHIQSVSGNIVVNKNFIVIR